jgi:hypothetical protein
MENQRDLDKDEYVANANDVEEETIQEVDYSECYCS